MKENKTHFPVICGDFNAKVGLKADPTEIILGNYESLLENNLYIMNSFYGKKHHLR